MQTIKDLEAFHNMLKSDNFAVVHFAANFVPQCAQVEEFLLAMEKQSEYAEVKFVAVNAQNCPEISLMYHIEAAPTILFFKSNKVVDRVDGVHPEKMLQYLQKHYGPDSDKPKAPLEDRLKALISKASVMLFMKGDRKTPKCGFSRTMIELLNKTGAAYETFDILTDDEVRQGLKIYSDWPTYPQLYVKGELIGGLDIVKAMEAGGELNDCLN